MNNGPLWKLVGHELKWRRSRRTRMPRAVRLAYAIVLACVLIAVAITRHGQSAQDMEYIWMFAFSMPFISFGISIGAMAKEWRSGTVGWWLTLPLPRSTLVLAKVIAMIIRLCIFFGAFYVAMLLFALIALVAHHAFQPSEYAQFALVGLKWLAIGASGSPFGVALGTLFGVVIRSYLRPIVPLFWVVLVGGWWIGVGHHAANLFNMSSNGIDIMSVTPAYWALFVASLLLGGILVSLSSFLLERKLAM